jgi:hypothetical protein
MWNDMMEEMLMAAGSTGEAMQRGREKYMEKHYDARKAHERASRRRTDRQIERTRSHGDARPLGGGGGVGVGDTMEEEEMMMM